VVLMNEFQEWRDANLDKLEMCSEEEDQFEIFLIKRCNRFDPKKMLTKLAWEIYQLQICMDGILEDES